MHAHACRRCDSSSLAAVSSVCFTAWTVIPLHCKSEMCLPQGKTEGNLGLDESFTCICRLGLNVWVYGHSRVCLGGGSPAPPPCMQHSTCLRMRRLTIQIATKQLLLLHLLQQETLQQMKQQQLLQQQQAARQQLQQQPLLRVWALGFRVLQFARNVLKETAAADVHCPRLSSIEDITQFVMIYYSLYMFLLNKLIRISILLVEHDTKWL